MKRIKNFALVVLGISAISCSKVQDFPENQKAPVQSLTATISDDDATKTAFVGGVFMWKKNDNMVVRSNNANGFSTFTYKGDDTAGSATFSNASEDVIVYGNNSFAYYPAKVNTTGTTKYPCEEDGSLKLVLKDSYTWFDGNVEAPMLAKVESGQPLEFKHLGGVLKLTFKNVPRPREVLVRKRLMFRRMLIRMNIPLLRISLLQPLPSVLPMTVSLYTSRFRWVPRQTAPVITFIPDWK